jgi:hypothetical protein
MSETSDLDYTLCEIIEKILDKNDLKNAFTLPKKEVG